MFTITSKCGVHSTHIEDTDYKNFKRDIIGSEAEFKIDTIINLNPQCKLTSSLSGPSAALLSIKTTPTDEQYTSVGTIITVKPIDTSMIQIYTFYVDLIADGGRKYKTPLKTFVVGDCLKTIVEPVASDPIEYYISNDNAPVQI